MKYLNPICFLVFAIVLVVVPVMADNEYELRLFMLFLIYGMIAVGLNVLVGMTGLVSLGQAGLFALGSYAGAILAMRLGFDIVAAGIGAAIVSGLFGVLLAFPTVRVRGVYLAVVTIAFGIIVENVAIEWQSLTGGTTGLTSIPRPNIFGIPLSGFAFYGVLSVTLFVLTLLIHNLKLSRYGRTMLAVSQSETAARALGINPTGMRTMAFVISSVTAGIAGTFYAFLNSYISPDIFTFSDSVRFPADGDPWWCGVNLRAGHRRLYPDLSARVPAAIPALAEVRLWRAAVARDVRTTARHPRHARIFVQAFPSRGARA